MSLPNVPVLSLFNGLSEEMWCRVLTPLNSLNQVRLTCQKFNELVNKLNPGLEVSRRIYSHQYKVIPLAFEKEDILHLFPFSDGKLFFYIACPGAGKPLEKGLVASEPLRQQLKQELELFENCATAETEKGSELSFFKPLLTKVVSPKILFHSKKEFLISYGWEENTKFKHAFSDENSVYCYLKNDSVIHVYREGKLLLLKPGLGRIKSVVPLKGLFLAVLVQEGVIHFIKKADGKWVKTLKTFKDIPAMGVSQSGEQLILFKGWHFSQAHIIDYAASASPAYPLILKRHAIFKLFEQCARYQNSGIKILGKEGSGQFKKIKASPWPYLWAGVITLLAISCFCMKSSMTWKEIE